MTLVFLLSVVTLFGVDSIALETLRVLAALATFISLTRLIEWMRLFEPTAFYVLLILETLRDVKNFIFLLMITFLMFGVPVLMLDMNSAEDYEMIDDTWHNWLPNLLFNQYMLAMG